ncbi:MAG: thiamine pyrophosphate-dependent dehydrogenase E1 component subunit alpha, partial [Eubacteriales bacterium]|nr:thiamine pyrophosphate-dependent dehydrogenase E1 component subunit alpha [Eubacteriales bacterium]
MAELFGKEGGCSKGRGGSMHMYKKSVGFLGTNGMVGGGIGLAVGAGLTIKTLRKDAVSVVFFGDGASNMGIFYESLNLASALKLPVIFICENNLYATSTPLRDIAANPEIATRGGAFHIASVAIDGNDVIKVYETVAEAIERAKRGDGPTLIEAKTYRQHGHHEGDQLYGTYRTKEELDTWIKMKDPIENYKKRLICVFEMSEDNIASVEQKVEDEIREAIDYAKNSREPDPADVARFVFREAR